MYTKKVTTRSGGRVTGQNCSRIKGLNEFLGHAWRSVPMALLALSAYPVTALGQGLVVGPGIVYGDGTHNGSVHTIAANPGGVAGSPRVGLQFGASAGVGYEVGDVSDIIDSIEEISDVFDKEGLTLEEAQNEIDNVQDLLEQLGRDGRGKLHGKGSVPIVIGQANAGWALAVEIAGEAHVGFSVLDDELRFEPQSQEIQSRTSLYLKGAQIRRLSVAPSFQVAKLGSGRIYMGARVNSYDAEMYKTVIALQDTDKDPGEVISDELDRQVESSTAMGLDLGVIYQASIFRGGLTWLNVNEPEFDFPTIGSGCGQLTDPDQQANCYTAASFSNEIGLRESWQLNEQARAEFAFHDPAQRLILAGSYELNSVLDVSGDEYQWLSLSASYRLPWYLKWIPDLRVGYRANQVGSELSYYSAGLTWLGILTLDAAVSEQTIDYEGDSIPRSAMANLGVQLRF